MSEHSSNIFIERSGIGIREDLEVLLRPPESPLEEAEQVLVLQFAHDLMRGEHAGLRAETDKSLEEIFTSDAAKNQLDFYIDYFTDTSQDGLTALQRHGYAGAWEPEDIKKFLATSDNLRSLPLKERTDLANASLDYAKEKMAQKILDDPEGINDAGYIEEDETTIHFAPNELLEKFSGLLAYRRFYKQVKIGLASEATSLEAAKSTLLDVHIGKVNSLLAEAYPGLLALKTQMLYMEPSESASLRAQIDGLLPVVYRLFRTENEKIENSFLRRLDYLRNGMYMHTTDEGVRRASPISRELTELLSNDKEDNVDLQASVDEETLARMDMTKWNAEALGKLIEGVLGDWGLLSQERATWVEVKERTGKAADGKYQVVIQPSLQALGVDRRRGVVKVPEKFLRSLTQMSPAGALPVAAHELAHVVQNVTADKMAETLPIAAINGRHFLTVREAGGLFQEKEIQEKYFGRHYSVRPHYLRALDRKLAGGNKLETTREFFSSYTANFPDDASPERFKSAAELAVDRALRLYRNGGHNSQPLDYAEQGLIVRELEGLPPEQIASFVLTAGTFDIKDAVKLHRFGLLPVVDNRYQPTEAVMSKI